MKKFMILSSLLLGACTKHESPNFVYMPDMAFSPAIKAQEPGSMRVPPAGTVPRNEPGLRLPPTSDEAGKTLQNPLHRTKANLLRGKELFNVYCIVCHGAQGLGNGPVVPKFPPPPSLVGDKVKAYPDGKIFHIISRGQNLMPSYATQILPEDRWAITHYVRALYRAQNPTDDDLNKAKNW